MSKFVQITNEEAKKSYSTGGNWITEPGEYILTVTTASEGTTKAGMPSIDMTCEGAVGTAYEGQMFTWRLYPKFGDTDSKGLAGTQRLFKQVVDLHADARRQYEKERNDTDFDIDFEYFANLVDKIFPNADGSTGSFITEFCKMVAGKTIVLKLNAQKDSIYLNADFNGARLYTGELPVKNDNDGWGKPELDVSKPF